MQSRLRRAEALAMGMGQVQSKVVSGESARRLLRASTTGFGMRRQLPVTVISSGFHLSPGYPDRQVMLLQFTSLALASAPSVGARLGAAGSTREALAAVGLAGCFSPGKGW